VKSKLQCVLCSFFLVEIFVVEKFVLYRQMTYPHAMADDWRETREHTTMGIYIIMSIVITQCIYNGMGVLILRRHDISPPRIKYCPRPIRSTFCPRSSTWFRNYNFFNFNTPYTYLSRWHQIYWYLHETLSRN